MQCRRILQPSAWDVYVALCEMADADTGVVISKFFRDGHPTQLFFRELSDITGFAAGTIRNALSELRVGRTDKDKRRAHAGGWTGVRDGRLTLLVGTFLAQKRKPQPSPISETASPDSESPSPDSEASSPISEGDSPISEAASPDSENAYIGTRASANPANPANQASHTHTPTRPPLVLVTPAAGGKVCVCGLTVTLELLRRFWRNQTPPPHNVEAMVGKSFDECFRHAQVREWLERQSAPAEKPPELLDPKGCPDCGGTGFYEPGGRGKGVARCPHEGLYAQLAETVQARAHAPP